MSRWIESGADIAVEGGVFADKLTAKGCCMLTKEYIICCMPGRARFRVSRLVEW